MQKKILIAEDHPMVVKGLKAMIKEHVGRCEISETDSCTGLMNLLNRIKPEYCIADLNLSDGMALGCIENMMTVYPEINVLIYTTFPGALYARRLFHLGIHGFLDKKAPESELACALLKFLGNEFYISPQFLPLIFGNNRKNNLAANPFNFLSLKEITVMEYLLAGMSIKEASQKMAILPNTAATYKKRAFEKLKIENLVQLGQLYQAYGGSSSL